MTKISISVTENPTALPANVIKRYNMSDADFQMLLDTTRASVSPTPSPPMTNEQLTVIWMQRWMDQTIRGIQRRNTTPPPPIAIVDA